MPLRHEIRSFYRTLLIFPVSVRRKQVDLEARIPKYAERSCQEGEKGYIFIAEDTFNLSDRELEQHDFMNALIGHHINWF
jgi:hypothetical protein